MRGTPSFPPVGSANVWLGSYQQKAQTSRPLAPRRAPATLVVLWRPPVRPAAAHRAVFGVLGARLVVADGSTCLLGLARGRNVMTAQAGVKHSHMGAMSANRIGYMEPAPAQKRN
jgi:hypothetical protein